MDQVFIFYIYQYRKINEVLIISGAAISDYSRRYLSFINADQFSVAVVVHPYLRECQICSAAQEIN